MHDHALRYIYDVQCTPAPRVNVLIAHQLSSRSLWSSRECHRCHEGTERCKHAEKYMYMFCTHAVQQEITHVHS